MNKPFSQACENNKIPILQVLKKTLTDTRFVLEIGSGTGQHACYFASKLPNLIWQPTDKIENLQGINLWIDSAQLPNLKTAIALDIVDNPWPVKKIEAVFTANTLHIMSWLEVEIFFSRLASYLKTDGLFCVYGPFNYEGAYTSGSNQQFDSILKQRNPQFGIRDFEAVEKLANHLNIKLLDDIAMPANNRILLFKKVNVN